MNISHIENLIKNNLWESLAILAITVGILTWLYLVKSTEPGDKKRLTAILGLVTASAFFAWFTNGAWAQMMLVDFPLFFQWIILPALLITALTIILSIVSIWAWLEGGLENMKRGELGLIRWLVIGFSAGVVFSVVIGLYPFMMPIPPASLYGSFILGLSTPITVSIILGSIWEYGSGEEIED